MKIKIQIISIYSSLLFEFEKEDNTQRETILEAIKQRANLHSADLSSAFITPHSKWLTGIKNNLIKIGCKEKTIEEWDLWFAGDEVFSTKRGTKEFAKIQANYLAVKAYVMFMKDFENLN